MSKAAGRSNFPAENYLHQDGWIENLSLSFTACLVRACICRHRCMTIAYGLTFYSYPSTHNSKSTSPLLLNQKDEEETLCCLLAPLLLLLSMYGSSNSDLNSTLVDMITDYWGEEDSEGKTINYIWGDLSRHLFSKLNANELCASSWLVSFLIHFPLPSGVKGRDGRHATCSYMLFSTFIRDYED